MRLLQNIFGFLLFLSEEDKLNDPKFLYNLSNGVVDSLALLDLVVLYHFPPQVKNAERGKK